MIEISVYNLGTHGFSLHVDRSPGEMTSLSSLPSRTSVVFFDFTPAFARELARVCTEWADAQESKQVECEVAP